MTRQSIFIIEDEIITAQSIAKNVRDLGYQIVGIATSGATALKQIAKLRPDLILMDIRLKNNDIDGIAIAETLKEQLQLNIPVVYLTAHSDAETLERAKITEPFGYILKPYNKKDLEISIKMALHKHHQELQLIKQTKLLSTILNATTDGVVATNATTEIIYMNSAAQELTGWEERETVGKKATEVIQIIDALTNEPIPHPVEQVLTQRKAIYLDDNAVLIARDGSKIFITDSASPITNLSNDLEGAVLVFAAQREISPPASLSANEPQDRELETSQTLELQPMSVTEANLEQLRSYLIDLLLHELRIPLTIILSTSESLKRYRQRWTTQRQNQSFERIQKAVQKMTELLDNVTVWEQAKLGKLSFEPSLTNAIAFCAELLTEISLIDENNHELVFTHQGEAKNIYLDQTLLRHILNNLLLNAIKYSPSNSRVDFIVQYQDNSVIFQVRDRGIGIRPEDLEHIFESFYRASNLNHIPGTGLGLAIVKLCLELHQGKITIESAIDIGTTFTVILENTSVINQ